MYVHIENQLGFVGYDVNIVPGMVWYIKMVWYVIVCQYGMMLVSQGIVGYVIVCYNGMMLVSYGIVGYDMVYITDPCMTQCYDCQCMVWL